MCTFYMYDHAGVYVWRNAKLTVLHALHDIAEMDGGRVSCGASCHGLVPRMSVCFDACWLDITSKTYRPDTISGLRSQEKEVGGGVGGVF